MGDRGVAWPLSRTSQVHVRSEKKALLSQAGAMPSAASEPPGRLRAQELKEFESAASLPGCSLRGLYPSMTHTRSMKTGLPYFLWLPPLLICPANPSPSLRWPTCSKLPEAPHSGLLLRWDWRGSIRLRPGRKGLDPCLPRRLQHLSICSEIILVKLRHQQH